MTVEDKNGPAAPYQGPSVNSSTQGHGSKQEQDAVKSEAQRDGDLASPADDEDALNDGGQGGSKTD
ncbi:hypothetical protein QYS36_20745 [Pseudomonas sp. G34]|uniref:hypothetical protein n=1 Tax=Pseudomonas sp. G34 TaxID=3059083 RepID=UPI0028094CCC|nr:hypothetical protein [Pseudomonas sp. G34]MDQ7987374.1 hypothetical protein [Pseudomonas sp. G34]